ncbi:S-adenosyl-L-methionine-dependent methyltransferase [Plenodomus tracheiphilus IPT5]|uniref:S-adenosyl-L-methionine-dependent methyltransferase n=1 Tax=Plenodomus tracheiphilus IPT5 TaxID=1408161 RepID=A0A6A7AU55_9PLEO|nr:S-adenosyl-L-methionine-dependent methyltransferase [Plenodomus tracheiphilus IPT5]
MTARTGNITALVKQIQENAEAYAQFFSNQNLPEPSFDHGDHLTPGEELPLDVAAAREAAIEGAHELHDLLLGPLGLIVECSGQQYLLLCIQYLYRHKIAYAVPVDGVASFSEIAGACSTNEKDVTRFLRVAASQHVFKEVRKGFIAHTAASKMLLNNPMLESWTMNIAQEFWPAVSRAVDATEKWPGSEEPNESGYSLAHGTNENPFDVIKKDPKRQEQFVQAMSFSHMHPSYDVRYLVDHYDFSAIGRGTIVDIGGSQGQVSVAIAERFPDITCIVQDLPETIAGLDVPDALNQRVLGMPHDFLTLQPVRGADIYLLRWILHDWSDKYCITILQNLIPALKKGAKIVVNDICIPDPGQVSIRAERYLRIMDISMKAFNNARERDAETWQWLFKMADTRFSFQGIVLPKDARMAVITAEWTG